MSERSCTLFPRNKRSLRYITERIDFLGLPYIDYLEDSIVTYSCFTFKGISVISWIIFVVYLRVLIFIYLIRNKYHETDAGMYIHHIMIFRSSTACYVVTNLSEEPAVSIYI